MSKNTKVFHKIPNNDRIILTNDPLQAILKIEILKMLSHFIKLHCKKRKIHFSFLSIPFYKKHFNFSVFQFICDRDRIRTCDRLLRRQMLYPAELRDLILRFSILINSIEHVAVPIESGCSIQLSYAT